MLMPVSSRHAALSASSLECGNSEEALRAACLEETGLSIVDYMDTHEVEVSEE